MGLGVVVMFELGHVNLMALHFTWTGQVSLGNWLHLVALFWARAASSTCCFFLPVSIKSQGQQMMNVHCLGVVMKLSMWGGGVLPQFGAGQMVINQRTHDKWTHPKIQNCKSVALLPF